MELTHEIQMLAKLIVREAPVISVYLNTQWHDQHQRERVSTFLTRHLRQARTLALHTESARQSLERDVARLEQWGQRVLHGTVDVSMPGMALFVCGAAELWVELPSPRPFDDAFSLADRPALRQLARLDEDYASALLVLVDSRAARVYEIVLGGIVGEIDFTHEFPGRHKQGGWAQMRYQRHVLTYMERHHREVAAYVTSYLAAHPHAALILSGPQDIVGSFRTVLSEPVQQRILEALPLDMHATRRRLLDAAQEVLQRREQAEEQATIQRLLDWAGQRGLGVLGLQATLDAVNTSRVQQLVMQHTVRPPGWRCLTCDHLLAHAALQCPLCNGEVSTTDLGEDMVSAVLSADGMVELVEADERLTPYEGIGALVRYQ